MSIEINKPNKISQFLSNTKNYTPEFKALVLNLIDKLKSMKKVHKLTKVPLPTLYSWKNNWNEEGEFSLENFQGIGGGRKSKLTREQMGILKNELHSKEGLTTRQVKNLIKNLFNIEYSDSQVWRILRKIGMNLQKPYPQDYRRPENAEEILKERLKDTFVKIIKDHPNIEIKNIGLGLLDESSPQTTANTVRLWTFDKIRVKKTPKR